MTSALQGRGHDGARVSGCYIPHTRTWYPRAILIVSLPHKLTLEIIKKLGEPENPSAYLLPKGNIKTLSNLCRVSVAFKDLTEPILYSRINITNDNIGAFTFTILPRVAPSESNTSTHSACRYAALVKSLAFIGFLTRGESNEINQIVNILRVPKPALDRLLLDVAVFTPMHTIWPSELHVAIRET
ncbi:hypothetical protein FRB95_014112 [Tulasnella sp. JGI-2019a]|nr:hypothetical protein FRB95_014112 [Tulasnella sp. JGI-2019a]